MVAVSEYQMPVSDILEAKSRQEFIEELRSLVSNGGVSNLSQVAVNRLMLALLTDILDVGDTALKAATKNAEDIKELKKSSLILKYRNVFKARPYLVTIITVIVILYLAIWVIHTWREFELFWIPIYEFFDKILV